jgi:hypothetical protein
VRRISEDRKRTIEERVRIRFARKAARVPSEDNKTGFFGVRHRSDGKFDARITQDGVTKHLGCYATPEEAARAYDEAARNLFGESAPLNFPEKES